MNLFKKTLCVAAGCAATTSFAGKASATIFFNLSSHPDGAIAPPPYGLRLDGLNGDTSKEFTFDFSHPDSAMFLELDEDVNTVRIYGRSWGGEDIGAEYADPDDYLGLWDIDFTYNANVSIAVGDPDIEVVVTAEDHTNNTGTIAKVGNPAMVYDLQDEQGSHNHSFKFNNTSDHRLGGTGLAGPIHFVGWGWLNHAPSPTAPGEDFGHVYASDWLFVGEMLPGDPSFPAAPEPVTAVLSIGSLGALMLRASGRRTK